MAVLLDNEKCKECDGSHDYYMEDVPVPIKIMGLAPMAVHPKYQNQGVGSALIKEGIKTCKQKGYVAICVLGHTKYYPKFGFLKSSIYKIKSEYDVPEEAFMLLTLQSNALKNIEGVIKYHDAFSQLDTVNEDIQELPNSPQL